MSLLLRGGRVIDPANNLDTVQDVLLADGKIERLGRKIGRASCRERVYGPV